MTSSAAYKRADASSSWDAHSRATPILEPALALRHSDYDELLERRRALEV
jgi:hypothetical protein